MAGCSKVESAVQGLEVKVRFPLTCGLAKPAKEMTVDPVQRFRPSARPNGLSDRALSNITCQAPQSSDPRQPLHL